MQKIEGTTGRVERNVINWERGNSTIIKHDLIFKKCCQVKSYSIAENNHTSQTSQFISLSLGYFVLCCILEPRPAPSKFTLTNNIQMATLFSFLTQMTKLFHTQKVHEKTKLNLTFAIFLLCAPRLQS